MATRYVYFVSYDYSSARHPGFGNATMTLSRLITSEEDLVNVRDTIKEVTHNEHVIIIYFVLLRTEEEG